MKTNLSYPLAQHPELTPLINDLRWLQAKMAEAQQRGDISRSLLDALKLMKMAVMAAFWPALYEVSPLNASYALRLDLEGFEAVVVIVESPSEAEPVTNTPPLAIAKRSSAN